MADLLVPDGDTDRPSPSPSRLWAGRFLTLPSARTVAVLPAAPSEPVQETTAMPREPEDELARLLDRHIDPAGPLALPHDEEGDETGPDTAAPDTAGPDAAGPDGGPAAARSSTATGDLLPATRRRSHRVRRIAVAAVALLCVGALATWLVAGRSTHDVPTAAAPTAAAGQHVVAVALADGARLTGVSLLAAGEGGAQQVLVPSRLLLDVPGAGRIAVAQSLAPGSSAPGAAIADALKIRVDGTWVLEGKDLARLVDAVGGVDVDVDIDVTAGVGPGAKIVASRGRAQHLDGGQARAFAQLLVDGEPEAARLARQEQVLTAVLAALPTGRDARRALLSSGSLAPRGASLDAAVDVTGELRAPAADGTLGSTVLPVREIDSGGDVSSYGVDTEAAAAMVTSRLAGAAITVPAGGWVRVLVQNGAGSPGLGDAARAKLVAAGLQYVGGGNVDGFGVQESVVVLADGTSTSRARGLAVARALGLKQSALRVSDSTPTVADLVVVLGSDFQAS